MHQSVRHAHPPPALEVEVRRGPARTTVDLTGEVDLLTAGQLADALARLLAQGCRSAEIDLSGVGFMSVAGLAVLVEADRRYRDAGGRLELTRPTPACARLFTLTGLDASLTIRPGGVSRS